ncbi:hypothetical protein GW796_00080 [archaeon]|nr:hypothetical protein [archaeon]
MTIFASQVVTYAVVETDIGEFRVFKDGSIEKWENDSTKEQGAYRWFDTVQYHQEKIQKIIKEGISKLEQKELC